MKISCIILASGYGRRFGSNKLLTKINGKSLIELTMNSIPLDLIKSTVVVSQYDNILSQAKDKGFTTIKNPMVDDGISESIRLGLSAIDKDSDGCIFRVCDQPYLKKESVQLLADAFANNSGNIIALSYKGERGNPVIFPSKYFAELENLSGNSGGGYVIKQHIDELKLLEISDMRELVDVDTMYDLENNQPDCKAK